jgi:hypothetical protein
MESGGYIMEVARGGYCGMDNGCIVERNLKLVGNELNEDGG